MSRPLVDSPRPQRPSLAALLHERPALREVGIAAQVRVLAVAAA